MRYCPAARPVNVQSAVAPVSPADVQLMSLPLPTPVACCQTPLVVKPAEPLSMIRTAVTGGELTPVGVGTGDGAVTTFGDVTVVVAVLERPVTVPWSV